MELLEENYSQTFAIYMLGTRLYFVHGAAIIHGPASIILTLNF